MFHLPTKIMGASGQWCLISGYHLDVTFSNEDGDTTLKHIRNTSVWKEKVYIINKYYMIICIKLYIIYDWKYYT